MDGRINRRYDHDRARRRSIDYTRTISYGRDIIRENPAIRADINRWSQTRFPGNGWKRDGFPQRESLDIAGVDNSLQTTDRQRYSIIERIHPQLTNLERAERDLRSTEEQFTILKKNIDAPQDVLDAFTTNQLSPVETAYRDALTEVRNAYNTGNSAT